MRLGLITISILLLSKCVFCQFDPGAEQISLSGSNVTDDKNVFSLFNNAACLHLLNHREFGLFYSPSPFGLKELSNTFLAYSEPFDFGTIAVGAMYYGFDLYNEEKISLGYSNLIIKDLWCGLVLNLHSVRIKNYGSDLAFYLNIGLRIRIIENLFLGFSFSNVNRSTFGKDKNQIPSFLKTGLGYRPAGNVLILTSFEKDIEFKEEIMFGISYDIIKHFSLRSGFSTQISKFSAGLGFRYSIFNLNYGLVFHNDLGLTHQTDLIINLD